jgi:predicted dithiol-disulfide oxidoreductase (DUF899 family)
VNLPRVLPREEWLRERKALLAREREAAEALATLAAERRSLPMVKIEKEYVFEGPDGKASLLDLFDGRRQLIVYHFMFGPDWGEGCPHCSYLVDSMGRLEHLHARETSLVIVSRAPQAKISAFRERMGWPIPWYSSFGSDFNYDFHVTLDESVAPVEYDYKNKAELEEAGETHATSGEQGGLSVFIHDGNTVFHTYSAYGPGNDLLHGSDIYLDLTPLGRQNSPEWRGWLRHHDKYAPDRASGN